MPDLTPLFPIGCFLSIVLDNNEHAEGYLNHIVEVFGSDWICLMVQRHKSYTPKKMWYNTRHITRISRIESEEQ